MDRFFTERELCCGCGACAAVCKHQAIRMVQEAEGFLVPKLNNELCKHCGACEKVCPVNKNSDTSNENTYYGVQTKEDAVRRESSSGAAFVMLAQWVLKRNGVVFGAALLEGGKVTHLAVEEVNDLNRITKTKYVQSNMEDCYQKVKEVLLEDRYVLFVGTPCQTEALRRYMQEPKEKLILADLICYGVPSPGIWERYVKYLEKKHAGKLSAFYFRDKRNKDSGHTAAYVIDGKEYAGSLYRDLFCRAYFRNVTIRTSCYQCNFCTVNRNSDFTLGDFWGIEKVNPEFDDGMGTSLVICHTKKARDIWEGIKENTRWFSCTEQEILQPRLLSPTQRPKKRKAYMTLYRYLPFSVWINLFRK